MKRIFTISPGSPNKRWIVRKDSVVSPGSGHKVTTYAAFLPSYKKKWAKANEYLGETVKHYGKWVGPYPYNTIKAVLGDMHAGGGMEYPTVTIIDKGASSALKTVVVHEAGHNWFYGMLGSNEREHPWMDEGINTFYEKKTISELHDTARKLDININVGEDIFYYQNVATHTDQGIDQDADNFTRTNYGIDVYNKTAAFLRMLEEYMGEADFGKGMHLYYNKWHFKHPYPADFRACMEQSTAKDLTWFFDDLFFTDKRMDHKITKVKTQATGAEVHVRSNSAVLAPVLVSAYLNDTLVVSNWSPPFKGSTVVQLSAADWDKIRIDSVMPDAKLANNVYRRYGLSHKFALKIKPFTGLNVSEYHKLFLFAAAGYNQYDGFMAGLLLHDLTMPENRFRFAVAPMYSFETNSFVGAGSAGYMWYPDRAFKQILLQADGKSFHYNEAYAGYAERQYARYTKVAAGLTFRLKEDDANSSISRLLTLKVYNVWEDSFTAAHGITTQQHTYGLVRYKHTNDRTYNPFSYTGEAQIGADFAKVSLEGSIKIDYNKPRKALYVRGYLGKFFAINGDPAITNRYVLNTSYSGINDYLYDGTYLGRNAQRPVASQQLSMQEGGFKVPVFGRIARSDNYLATINVESDLPIKLLPVRLFVDAGLMPNYKPTYAHNSSTVFLYEAGLSVHLVKDFVYIYVPIVMSSDFKDYLRDSYGNRSFQRSVSFTMMFQSVNWLTTASSLLKKVGV